MREDLTKPKSERIRRMQIVRFHCLAVGVAGACVSAKTARLSPRFTVCPEKIGPALLLPLLVFAPVSSHRLRLKRLAEGDETTVPLPATTQPCSLPGLPLKSLSHCHQFIPHSL